MRQMSEKRRRVAVMASSLGAMSGVGPILLRGYPRARLVWLGFYMVLFIWVLVRLVQVNREERCG